MRTILLLALVLPFLAACGITERRQLAADRDPDQVWAAMKAVANGPDYYMASDDVGERWVVQDNQVVFDDDVRRMEVYRRLEREIHRPMAPVRREQRTWKFHVTLEQPEGAEGGEGDGPPVMVFSARNNSVPAHVWDEAKWYFDAVEAFLEPLPATAPAPSSAPAPQADGG